NAFSIAICSWTRKAVGQALEKQTNRLSAQPQQGSRDMATITDISTYRKPQAITHYAYYGDTYGTAELLNGSGYLFRAEGERKATLVSYKDAELVLLGRCDLAYA